jgi:transcriptional regulator with XRE-family HTH domain
LEVRLKKFVQIGASIKRLRRSARLTQAQLAEMVGLSRVAISNIELGNSRTKSDRLFAFADAFGVSIDELTGYAASPPDSYLTSLAAAGDRISELEQIVENLRQELNMKDRALVVIERVVARCRSDDNKGYDK